MKNILLFLQARSVREWGSFFLIVCVGVLVAVFASQSFGFHPCKLCIWQRWPYAVGSVLSLLLILSSKNKNLAAAFFLLLALTFAIGGGIAFFHLGVEYKWWEFHSDCASNLSQATSAEDFLERLKAAPIVRCDERVPFLFGMTMAFYNVLTSVGLMVLTAFALYSQRSNSLSQYK